MNNVINFKDVYFKMINKQNTYGFNDIRYELIDKKLNKLEEWFMICKEEGFNMWEL